MISVFSFPSVSGLLWACDTLPCSAGCVGDGLGKLSKGRKLVYLCALLWICVDECLPSNLLPFNSDLPVLCRQHLSFCRLGGFGPPCWPWTRQQWEEWFASAHSGFTCFVLPTWSRVESAFLTLSKGVEWSPAAGERGLSCWASQASQSAWLLWPFCSYSAASAESRRGLCFPFVDLLVVGHLRDLVSSSRSQLQLLWFWLNPGKEGQ